MHKIMPHHLLKYTVAALMLAGILCCAHAAEAGFRLKQTPTAEKENVSASAPASSAGSKTSAPVKETYDYPAAQTGTTADTALPDNDFTPPENSVVAGFGKDLPLVIALQQIAPEAYQFSFTGAVDPNTKVSWKGDRPWRIVLADMLATQGLFFREDRDIIVIEENTPAPAQKVATAAPAPERKPEPAKATTEDEKIETADGKPLDLKHISAPRVVKPGSHYAPPPPPEPAAIPVWEAQAGQTLREVLTLWSEKERVDLYWSIDYDYRIEKPFTYEGNYPTAVATLINRFKKSRPQPYGQLHKGSRTSLVLVIGSYDLTH